MAVITLTGCRQHRFAFICSSAVCDHERQALKAKVQRWPVKKESSTTAALNSLTDDGQAATCPKCCVIRLLQCSENNVESQANWILTSFNKL